MKKYILLFSTVIAMTLTSCSNDDPEIINEEELITTLRVTLTPQGGGNPVILEKKDLDGDGPMSPVTSVSGNLQSNKIYDGTVLVLNETETPADNITLEVLTEGHEHQFFYTFPNNIASVAYTDLDKNGRPIGINFRLTTTSAGSGNLIVTLRHEPIKTAAGVVGGNITNAGGETDIEATFSLTVN